MLKRLYWFFAGPRTPYGYMPIAVHDELMAGMFAEVARERLARLDAEKRALEAERWAIVKAATKSAR